MMANVAVRNWRFLYKMGISGCQWFEGIGNYLQVRKLALRHMPREIVERRKHGFAVPLSRLLRGSLK